MAKKKQAKAIGRPTKLTHEVHQRLVTLMRAGNYMETAAASAGLDSDTVRNWIKIGEREIAAREEGKVSPLESLEPLVAFAYDMRAAMADAEARAVLRLHQAGESEWRANLAFLERRFPDRWGERQHIQQQVEHSGEVMDLSKLTLTELRLLREMRRKAQSEK